MESVTNGDQENQFQNTVSSLLKTTSKERKRVSIEDPINEEILNMSRFYSFDIMFSNDDEPSINKINLPTIASNEKFHASPNIGVLNMSFDRQPSEQLQPIEVKIIFCTLQECLDILRILEYSEPTIVDESLSKSYKSLRKKYGDVDEENNTFQENIGSLSLLPTTAEKLQKDRRYICKVLEETLNDLKENKSYDCLRTEVDNNAKSIEYNRTLQIEFEIWTDLINQLKVLIASQRIKNEEELEDLAELALNTDVEADNVRFFNASKLAYVKKWEEERMNQQKLKLAKVEEIIIKELNEILKMESTEQVVLEDLQIYLQSNAAEIENEIKKWSDKHSDEVQRRELEIYELREAIDEYKQNLEQLYNLYDERQTLINEYHAEKERIKRNEEHLKSMYRAATIIQAFWKGCMVRKQLGEFQGLWARLRKRKRQAAIARKKRAAWQKKKTKQWSDTK